MQALALAEFRQTGKRANAYVPVFFVIVSRDFLCSGKMHDQRPSFRKNHPACRDRFKKAKKKGGLLDLFSLYFSMLLECKGAAGIFFCLAQFLLDMGRGCIRAIFLNKEDI